MQVSDVGVSSRQEWRKLSVLVPVYNEQNTLATLVRRVLAVDAGLELELVVVDDGSSDRSWEVMRELAAEDARVRPFRHDRNRGKGAAIRTAIDHMTGDIAVVQDADLEYDPNEYIHLLAPILDGRADAVFGSRFVGHPRRVLYFWHSIGNGLLTLLSNMVNDVNLTDMETCYKMVRAEVLRQLRLTSNTFTLEPEITCRLAQWGARMYEVPISYSGRTYDEGKKIGAIDGLKAVWELFRCRFLDTRFTHHSGFYILTATARAKRYNNWLLRQCGPYLGRRVLEAGSGIGNLSTALLDREHLVLADYDPLYIDRLRRVFGARPNVRVSRADLTNADDYIQWKEDRIDTILCMNVLEHLEPDETVLRRFYETLVPGGHCLLVVPAGKWLYTGMDEELGHCRRYEDAELRQKMERAGFEVVFSRRVSRFASLSWWITGRLMRSRHLSPFMMINFDRLFPLTRWLDYCLPIPGMSLVMVGRRQDKAGAVREQEPVEAYSSR